MIVHTAFQYICLNNDKANIYDLFYVFIKIYDVNVISFVV
ncbi:MAG: hypothetical protein JETT_2400 [Candidatus Jettenia ecosi]|uniref:Uncharacterized protein n=1 Tax=Candidatus Jettenia ecosi TaxID=2494326 RepID=A0A533QL94_9BACT|nr:MAG: hypothetical protein JETT_2400 [Candidatus Jettenia ecosi]